MVSVITTHINADFDALASLVAAKKLYPESIVVLPGSTEKRVREFIETFNPLPDIKKLRDIDKDSVREIIIVDTASLERLGNLKELLKEGKTKARIIIYDHHKNGDLLAEIPKTDIEVNIDDVGATSTLFTEIFQKKKIQISPIEATLLCLGIYEETGSLTYPSTTERDLLAVAYLLRRGANLNIISNFLKPFINREELSLLTDFMDESRDLIIGNIRIKISKARREEYPGEVAHLAHRIMEMENIDGIILLLEIAGKITIIARSNVPELDVSELLSPFGGGGHPTASSASIKDRSLEEIELEITERLKEIVRPQRLAKDIMTTHVISIEPDSNIKEAERELTKYGVNVLPVVKNGKLLGMISRETVEKALFHGFKLHKVIEFAEVEPEVVTPDTPVTEVERIMIEQNQRFMPVVKNGRLVGAITRTDILRTLYEGLLKKESRSDIQAPRIKNLSSRLKEHFPEKTLNLLIKAGEVAEILGYNAYLVGGSVRDLLRGERNLDIDIVIEGDGIIFAKKLAEFLMEKEDMKGIKVKTHERFGTAKIIIPQELKIEPSLIDIATARTEYYESPAALPKVETSSIKKDLYRRDFTINTLAIKLNPRVFGTLIDFFGGQKDLKEKTIRVLHSMSLVEDPTRALRAIRFSERFGFRISRHTENLIKQAVKLNLFEKLSSQRLYEELSLLFKELSPYRAMEQLSAYDLLRVIAPSLRWSEDLKKRFRNLEELLAWHSLSNIKEEISRDRLSLEAALYDLPRASLEKNLERIGPNSRYISEVEKDIKSVKEILQKLQSVKPSETDPVEIYELFKNLSMESIFLLAAVTDQREIKRLCIKYLTELKDVKPSITGKDLLKLGIKPGPAYSKIFKEVLYEKIRGKLRTKEEEIEFVHRLIRSGD